MMCVIKKTWKIKVSKETKYKCNACKKYVEEDLRSINSVVCSKCGGELDFEDSKTKRKLRRKHKYVCEKGGSNGF